MRWGIKCPKKALSVIFKRMKCGGDASEKRRLQMRKIDAKAKRIYAVVGTVLTPEGVTIDIIESWPTRKQARKALNAMNGDEEIAHAHIVEVPFFTSITPSSPPKWHP